VPSRPVARIFRAVGPAPWPTSRPLAEVRAAARRLAQQLVVGQPGDGEAVVAPEHEAAQPRVVVRADPGDFQDLEVAVDGPLGRIQGGGQGPGVAGRSFLEQLQQLEDAGESFRLAEPAVGLGPSFDGGRGRSTPFRGFFLRALTHLRRISRVSSTGTSPTGGL
jgi:hypothetical protein